MTATLGYPPDLDAAFWMHEQVLPALSRTVPNTESSLVGQAAPRELRTLHDPGRSFIVVGMVPDVRPFLQAADVFVLPLRMGSGTRRKAVEALASGQPLVYPSLEVDGLELSRGRDVLVADDVQGFAAAIEDALTTPALRRTLVHQGRETAVQKYEWRQFGPIF